MKEGIEAQRRFLGIKVDELEKRMAELEYRFNRMEEEDNGIDLLRGYARRLHCGLIPNQGFVEENELRAFESYKWTILWTC